MRIAPRIVIGTALILIGVVLAGPSAWELWGTGIGVADRQAEALEEWRTSEPASAPAAEPTLPAAPAKTSSSSPDPEAGVEASSPASAEPGDAIAELHVWGEVLPVMEGVEGEVLDAGLVGRYPETAPLGSPTGRSVITAHRTTHGSPFYRLGELEVGDGVELEAAAGELIYQVTDVEVIEPEDVWILDGTGRAELVLIACHPIGSTAQRLAVTAELVGSDGS